MRSLKTKVGSRANPTLVFLEREGVGEGGGGDGEGGVRTNKFCNTPSLPPQHCLLQVFNLSTDSSQHAYIQGYRAMAGVIGAVTFGFLLADWFLVCMWTFR